MRDVQRLAPRWRRDLPVALAALVTAVLVLTVGPQDSTGSPWTVGGVRADVGIIGDDEHDAFVGNGSLILPPQVFHDGRVDASDCLGCSWRAVVQCEMTTAGSCRGPARLCGPNGQWLRVYLTRPGAAERDLGAACYSEGGPVSRWRVESSLTESMIEFVPPLRPGRLPAGDALVQLPVYVDAGQEAGPREIDTTIVDLAVHLRLDPEWRWDFGDGRRISGEVPTADHTYRRAASPLVRVATIWRGTYWVVGLGPLAVDAPVTQEASMVVPVGEGRAILIH
jgi:hypothetical protein